MAHTEALEGVSITISGMAITFVINKFYMTSLLNPNSDVIDLHSYPVRDIVTMLVIFFYLVVFLCIVHLASLAAFAHNFLSWLWTRRPRYRVVNLLVHLLAALMMIDCFLTVNESHYLPESSSISLFIFLIVTVSFVCVMGYEAWKKRDVLEYGRASRSSVVMFGGLALLSLFLLPLINILVFGNFENWIASDKAKHSLYTAAISFCFLSYVLSVINALLNSIPPKMHSEAHREKVNNALGILNFVSIFLVIVTVVTITACHLGEYALLNAIPLLAGLAWPHAKVLNLIMSNNFFEPKIYLSIMAVIVAVLAAAIIQWESTLYRDMSKLFVSMGLVLYLSQKLATFTQPSIRGLEKENEHLGADLTVDQVRMAE